MKFTSISVKSMNSENIVPTTICRYCLFSKPSLKRMTWVRIRKILNMKLVVPTLKPDIRLETS
ncbi:MAG: hypothetical protein IKF11_03385 [Methanobrevibacter sp.]|nr:hypothetical protein [Methanobrevibacter sp.]